MYGMLSGRRIPTRILRRYVRVIGCSSRSISILSREQKKTLLRVVVQRGLVRRGASLLWFISFDFDPLLSVLRL